MGRYVIRRLLQFIPVLLGTMFLLHYLQVVSVQINGDPIRALFGDRQPPENILNAIRAQFGLDDGCYQQAGNPCFQLFIEQLGKYARFDFGTDFNNQAVSRIILDAAPITIRLTVLAVLFESVVGILAGIAAALRRNGALDVFVLSSTVLVISVPVFVLGVLVQILSGLYIGERVRDAGAPEWMQAIFSVTYQIDYPWLSLLVPAIVLGSFSLGFIARLTRASLIESMRADYVRTAKAKGLSGRRVVGVHALRNSLIPVVTYIGIDLGALMGGALVTEGIFNIPGIGGTVFIAVRQGETVLVVSVVTLLVLVFLLASLLVDVLYAVLDPRIRYE